jgi:hypothetical protein
MQFEPLACTRCGAPLPEQPAELAALTRCSRCGAGLRVAVFPAWRRPSTRGASAELVLTEGEASCFYHTDKRAVIPCDACGRFLCALCDMEIHGRHFCPACFAASMKQQRIEHLERERTRYDNIALSLLIYPLILCGFLVPVSAPAALILALWKWSSPPSLVERTKLRLAAVMVLALVETGLGLAFWFGMFSG